MLKLTTILASSSKTTGNAEKAREHFKTAKDLVAKLGGESAEVVKDDAVAIIGGKVPSSPNRKSRESALPFDSRVPD